MGALAREHWDAVVIGAGIAGTAAAYDLATRGYQVCLIDKGDIGSGTSQATTNLIHGGLRYLKRPFTGVPLVRKALRERNWLRHAAPHLVTPLDFLMPVYDRSPDSRFALKLGLLAYDLFSGGKPARHRMLSRDEVLAEEPGLAPDGLKGGAMYTDCQVRPERLCLAYAKSAERAGASIRTYAECTDIHPRGDTVDIVVQDRFSQEAVTLETRCLVNASGPWVDALCRKTGDTRRKLTLTKGIHLIYPALTEHAVYAPALDGRYVFTIPWRGHALIGTTDTRHEDPDAVSIEPDDVRYLIDAARALFPTAGIAAERIVSFTHGLRPLQHNPRAKESDITRDYTIEQSDRLLSLIGVKLTTARAAAEDIGDRVNRLLGHDGKSTTALNPLYGGDLPEGFLECSQGLIAERKRNYGTATRGVEAILNPYLRQRVCACLPVILAEAVYAARHEHVRTADDFLRRRVRADLCTCGKAAERVIPVLASELGWSARRQRAELDAWNAAQERTRAWKKI